MKALRKDSGGYALLYVLIIVVVLCAIAAAICTVALRNYQEQARAVAQTRQLYQAEGEIEKLAALAEDLYALSVADDDFISTETAKNAYQQQLGSQWTGAGCTPLTFDGSDDSFTVSVEYANESVRISAELQMHLKYKEIPHYLNGFFSHNTYEITEARLKQYNSYTITHLTAEGGEEHETE